MSIFDFSGRVALVTGAGQNVGAGIARMLAAQGARVAVNDAIPERAAAVATEIGATAAPFDVTDLAAVTAGMRDVADALGPVDILVNNAGNGGVGGMVPTKFRDMDPSAWDGPIRVNLYGVLNCCKALVDGMCERGWGRIITISSGAGTTGVNIGVSPYSGGKGGAIAFMRSLALEVAPNGVTANSLALGVMPVAARTVTDGLAASVPVGRIGTPEDVGAACVWLASNEAAWVTGQTIHVNGGSVTT
jgi:NAD(P)-dependent dehydrogenase (short-subunit alcohol dehydrogenase family)